MSGVALPDLATRLLAWFEGHGRRNLPWQQQPTPYRVWVSEIMLQQTQVATVIPYYRAFMERFPDVGALARAPIDEVLHRWSGLGYYARARHLHRAAQIVVDEQGGVFPESLEGLMSLPGIGRSTAGAVLALARGARHPILDGNARRVLARAFAVDGFPGEPQTLQRLWTLAERCTPGERVAEYTQAIMDLGATVCIRRRPLCHACPLADGCLARLAGRQEELPPPRPRRARPLRTSVMLLAVREGPVVLLERRPPHGIWGGLWGLPEFDSAGAAYDWCIRAWRANAAAPRRIGTLRHTFTHFDLDIEAVRVDCAGSGAVMESDRHLWYNPAAPQSLGLAAPVRTLIESVLVPSPSPLPRGGEREKRSSPLAPEQELLFPLPLAGEG
jgi:A/G-specific adenine glycosylase